LAVGIADFRAGRKDWLIVVNDSRNSLQEKGEVRKLGKSRQLADAVLSNVYQFLDLRLLQLPEELLGRLLREAYRE
jgi:hypothetical protein